MAYWPLILFIRAEIYIGRMIVPQIGFCYCWCISQISHPVLCWFCCLQLLDENRWYNFDDSHISPINEEDVKSAAAYVLFYRRVKSDTSASDAAGSRKVRDKTSYEYWSPGTCINLSLSCIKFMNIYSSKRVKSAVSLSLQIDSAICMLHVQLYFNHSIVSRTKLLELAENTSASNYNLIWSFFSLLYWLDYVIMIVWTAI